MKRVFLGGTTTGTTWRKELTARLIERGVRPEQIVNPHLPAGIRYTHEHMRAERKCKDDTNTIVLIFVCPAIAEDTKLDSVSSYRQGEWLGPISMFEIGKFAYSQSRRTAVVLDFQSFSKGGRARKVLEGLASELRDDFRGRPPYFSSLAEGEDWIVAQLG